MVRSLIPLLVFQWILGCKSNPMLYLQLRNCYFKVLVYCHSESKAIFWNSQKCVQLHYIQSFVSSWNPMLLSLLIVLPFFFLFFFLFCFLKLLLLWKWDQAFRDVGTCIWHKKISCCFHMPLSLCSEWNPLVARIYLDMHLYFLSNTVV